MKSFWVPFLLLSIIGGLTILFSLHSGPVVLPWSEIIDFLSGKILSDESRFLLADLRFPRTLAAFAVGASLGVSGLVLQSLLRNPLAEPYTLGLSGGSSLGAVAALSLALEPASLWIPVFSTLGCLTATALVLSLTRRALEIESRSLILFGVMISLFFGAMVVTLLSLFSPQKLQTALFWLLGEFGTQRDAWIFTLGPILIVGHFVLFFRARSLDILILGDARALSLGRSPAKERSILIGVCTLLTALSVAISGLVGFIGLVSPHLARKIMRTSRHRVLIAASFLIGGSLLTLADALGQVLAGSSELPAGSLAALIGAPVLVILLLGHHRAQAE